MAEKPPAKYHFSPETLIKAYSIGVFPMAMTKDDPEIHFFEPEMRGVIPITPPHIPKRLLRQVKQARFEVHYNTAFHQVISECAKITTKRDDSWINSTIIALFVALHAMGFAHSVEIWDDTQLVGGLYGLKLGSVFFGESMFSHVPNASKIALAHLMMRLHYGGFHLLDAQFGNDHLRQFGLIEIPKSEFQSQLTTALQESTDLHLSLTEGMMVDHFAQAIKVTS